jgi:hypothetical protein
MRHNMRSALLFAVAVAAGFLLSGPGLASAAGFVNYGGAATAQYTAGAPGVASAGGSSGVVSGTQAAGAAVTTTSGELPFTGLNVSTILVLGLALFALGAGLRVYERSARRS